MKQSIRWIGLAIAGLALLGGCSESSLTGDGSNFLMVSFQDTAPLDPLYKASAVEQVKVTEARIVIGRIQLEGSGNPFNFRTPEHEPLIVNLDLNGNFHDVGIVPLQPGTYDRSLFRIEKLEVADSSVYNANPEMQDLSIRIEGYLNGDPDNTFVFTSELDEEQQHQFDPVTYVAGSAYHLVFRFDHRNWFSDGEGGYIDPNEAQIASSRSIVEENIKDGFDVYQP
ncbi:MAG: hypothetical protein AB1690_09915 [Candidatus Zixiibacteriota bacterium]